MSAMPTRILVLSTLLLALLLPLGGCAKEQTMPPAAWRSKLRDAIMTEVSTRDLRNEHSRMMQQAVDEGALKGLKQPEVQAALGKARNCSVLDICSDNGFQDDDWYYELGQMGDEDKVKQLPILIIGFGHKGEVVRVFAYTTH